MKRPQRINITDNGLVVSFVSLNCETNFCHAIKYAKVKMRLGQVHFEYQFTLKLHLAFAAR